MLPKFVILKCAFLLTLSRVSGFFVLQINNLDEDDLVSAVLNAVNKGTVRDAGNNSLNNIAVRGRDLLNYLWSRRSGNAKKYFNRRLVKRIVPHGYVVKDVELDEKFQTLYKPLVRIHKQKAVADEADNGKDENKYELVIVLDDDQHKDVTEVLPDEWLLKPFTIDNVDIKSLPDDNNIEDAIRKIRKYPDSDFTKYKLFDQIPDLNAKRQRNDDGFLRPRREKMKAYSISRMPLKFKKAYKTKLLDQARLVQKHHKRENNLDTIRDDNFIPKKLEWFGPVGHLVSKQLQGKDRREKANKETSKPKHSKKDIKRSVDIKQYFYLLNKMLEMQKQTKEKDIDDKEISKYINMFNQVKAVKPFSHVKQKKKANMELKTPSKHSFLSQLDHRNAEINKKRHFRMRAVNEKSGEEGFVLPKFSWHQTEGTTEPARNAVPKYPFYNYWTYEKSIHQDKCKGSLIQLGQLCIGDE